MNKQGIFDLTMKLYTTTNQDFGKTTWHTDPSRFCIIKFSSVRIRAWWMSWYWLTSKKHLIRFTTIKNWALLVSKITLLVCLNRLCRVNLENCQSDPFNITFGVTQGCIFGPLLFLIYVNDIPQAVKWNLFLYADDSYFIFQGKDVMKIEKKIKCRFWKKFWVVCQ